MGRRGTREREGMAIHLTCPLSLHPTRPRTDFSTLFPTLSSRRDDQLLAEMSDIARVVGQAEEEDEEWEEELVASRSTVPIEGGAMVRHE